MSEHELETLLGGFAADTLTQQERERLFRAALQDQQLFNALADEQALKELLADPAVRSRLLQALDRQGTQGSMSWWDRFSTPSGLTWAGGVAVGVFAVVLGLRVYQDSLRQASPTAAVEEGKPEAPPAAPQVQASTAEREIAARSPVPIPEPASQAPSDGTIKTREQQVAAQGADSKRTNPRSRTETQSKNDASTALLGKSAERPATSEERPERPSAPVAGLRHDILAETDTGPSTTLSARALFYAGDTVLRPLESRPEKKEAEPAPRPEQFALTRKALDRTEAVKPLGIRYRIIGEGAAEPSRAVELTVESNQDAYLQIWRRSGESLPELILPAKDTGRISMKTARGQRQQVTVEEETDRLIVRLSRVPFGPITRQEAVMAGRGAQGQVTESVSGTEEPADYVANPDPSAMELAIDIVVGTRTTR